MICPALLICTAITLSYIGKVENDEGYQDGRLEFEVEVDGDTYVSNRKFDASGSRGAAGWSLFVSCVGCIFHANAMIINTRCREFDIEKHNAVYSVTVRC